MQCSVRFRIINMQVFLQSREYLSFTVVNAFWVTELTCIRQGAANPGGKESANVGGNARLAEQAEAASRAVLPPGLHGADVQVHGM